MATGVTLEHHEYMNFRFGEVIFTEQATNGTTGKPLPIEPTPAFFTLQAWVVHYPFESARATAWCSALGRKLPSKMPIRFPAFAPREALPCMWPMAFLPGVHNLLPNDTVHSVQALKVFRCFGADHELCHHTDGVTQH
jgi:hypothetical protein